MIKIIDGVGEKEHVTAEDVALSQIGTIGGDTYILEAGNNLGYQIISANEVDIKDGVFMVQGRRGCVIPGSVERCSIRTGSQGKKRNDLICVKYEKNTESKVETFTLEVVEGQEGASGIDPVLTTGDINAGATLHYAALYRVKINGITIDAVEQMAKTYKSGKNLEEQIEKNKNDIGKINDKVKIRTYTSIKQISDRLSDESSLQLLINLMENNSVFFSGVGQLPGSGWQSQMPEGYGTLKIERKELARVNLFFYPRDGGRVYIATFSSSTEPNLGWWYKYEGTKVT